MERRNPRSTADLLTWTEGPASDLTAAAPQARPHQPSGGIAKVVFGGQVTDEEVQSLLKRKPCSGSKMKEITGSGIFEAESKTGESETGNAFSTPNSKTGLKQGNPQAVSTISHIKFTTEESVTPKKPTSIAEVAKQRELSGTLADSDSKMRKNLSDAKCKELSGHDIFGPPPEVPSRSLAARTQEIKENKDFGEPLPRNIHTSVKVSNPAGGPSSMIFSEETASKTTKKIHNQKAAELTGNDIFRGEAPPGSAEKSLSVAKLREMSGSNIFADGKVEAKDYFGGVRKPPGGESSIALI